MKTKNYLTPFLFTLFFFLIACSIQKQPLSSNQNNTTTNSANSNANAMPSDVNSATPTIKEENKVLNTLFNPPKKRNP